MEVHTLADDSDPRPLAGVRVLEFAETLPGPYCGKLLVDLGASVVKVERAAGGDPLRSMMPNMFEVFNRGKRSVTVDLKKSAAAEVVAVLFRSNDIVLESFRPGVADRLGIGWDVARRVNPRLVYCAISGFGQHGPGSHLSGHDATYAASSGVLGLVAHDSRPPTMPPLPMGDMASGSLAALSVLALLLEARQTGRGRYCDLAITDVMATWTGSRASDFLHTGELPRVSEQQPPTHGLYRAADGRHIAVGAIEDHFWKRLCVVIGRPDWARRTDLQTNRGRAQAGPELEEQLVSALSTAPAQVWVDRFVAADVPAAVVLGIAEAVESEQLRARGVFAPTGRGWSVGYPALLDGEVLPASPPAPVLGASTAVVLRDAGCSKQEVAGWQGAGVFGHPLMASMGGGHRV